MKVIRVLKDTDKIAKFSIPFDDNEEFMAVGRTFEDELLNHSIVSTPT
jgi:hypothetical protein